MNMDDLDKLECKFHRVTDWNNGTKTHFCKFVKDNVDCDGISKTDLLSCPL